jgi:hypothetical protein
MASAARLFQTRRNHRWLKDAAAWVAIEPPASRAEVDYCRLTTTHNLRSDARPRKRTGRRQAVN